MLEAERDEYAQQNAELFVLQQVFSTINSTLDINDILSMVLRGVCEALRFGRVILFDVDEHGTIVRRLEGDAAGAVLHAADAFEYLPNSTLYDVARGTLQIAYGNENDADKPLNDTKGSYCIAPLVARDVVRGMLYADDPPAQEVTENQTARVARFCRSSGHRGRECAPVRRDAPPARRDPASGADRFPHGHPEPARAHRDAGPRAAHSERYDTPFAFIILDLDDLKKINDSGGHSLGDLALKRFANVLKKAARKGDIIARYAGDEFVLVMAKTGRDAATRGVERILSSLRRNGLQSSIGVAMFPGDGTDGQTLFFAADEALYHAKQAGKNGYRFYQRGAAAEGTE